MTFKQNLAVCSKQALTAEAWKQFVEQLPASIARTGIDTGRFREELQRHQKSEDWDKDYRSIKAYWYESQRFRRIEQQRINALYKAGIQIGLTMHSINVMLMEVLSGKPEAAESLPAQKPKLPKHKITDLSVVPGIETLTGKQHEILSLRVEYGLNVSQIARHLGLVRKTVDEHLAWAEKKLKNYSHSAPKRAGRAEEDTMIEYLDSSRGN
jgi:DNA-binding CsgD family transcriptional regulator